MIVNGGSATGTTALTIKNASASNAGAATTGAGIPVVVAANGGTTSTNAFQLANTPVVAGGSNIPRRGTRANQDWYLTSSPLPSPENAITAAISKTRSTALAQVAIPQMVTTRLLGSLLLGADEQISGCDCGGGFAGVGSFASASHGRWASAIDLTLLAGASLRQLLSGRTNVTASPIVAASLRYDPADWGTQPSVLRIRRRHFALHQR